MRKVLLGCVLIISLATPAMAQSLSDQLVGMIMFSAGEKPPSADWLACDGKDYQRRAYPKLFAAVGVRYGVSIPENNQTFRVPDMRGKVAVAVGSKDAPLNKAVGDTAGEVVSKSISSEVSQSGGQGFYASPRPLTEAPNDYNHATSNHTHTVTVQTPTVQPSMILTCFIKAR